MLSGSVSGVGSGVLADCPADSMCDIRHPATVSTTATAASIAEQREAAASAETCCAGSDAKARTGAAATGRRHRVGSRGSGGGNPGAIARGGSANGAPWRGAPADERGRRPTETEAVQVLGSFELASCAHHRAGGGLLDRNSSLSDRVLGA